MRSFDEITVSVPRNASRSYVRVRVRVLACRLRVDVQSHAFAFRSFLSSSVLRLLGSSMA